MSSEKLVCSENWQSGWAWRFWRMQLWLHFYSQARVASCNVINMFSNSYFFMLGTKMLSRGPGDVWYRPSSDKMSCNYVCLYIWESKFTILEFHIQMHVTAGNSAQLMMCWVCRLKHIHSYLLRDYITSTYLLLRDYVIVQVLWSFLIQNLRCSSIILRGLLV